MKTDARVRYTKMRIKDAFLESLAEKHVSKITVKEICEKAEINRATFYSHYSDPYDLLDKLEEEALGGIMLYLEQRRDNDGSILLSLINSMTSDDSSIIYIASENGDPAFIQKVSALFYNEFFPVLKTQLPELSERRQEEFYRFLTAGCGSILSRWITSPENVSPEEISEHIEALSSALLTAYKTLK